MEGQYLMIIAWLTMITIVLFSMMAKEKRLNTGEVDTSGEDTSFSTQWGVNESILGRLKRLENRNNDIMNALKCSIKENSKVNNETKSQLLNKLSMLEKYLKVEIVNSKTEYVKISK